MNTTTVDRPAPVRPDDQPAQVRHCLTCGTRSDLAECDPCAIAEETLWKRLVDL